MAPWMGAGDVETHLSELERLGGESHPSPDEMLARLTLFTAAVNAEMLQSQAAPRDEAALGSFASGGVVEKLEKWINRLRESLGKILAKMAKGTSFSISVGSGGLNVTVNFPPV